MKVSRHPCRKLLSPLKPSTSLRPASPFQHLTSAFSHSSTLFCTPQKLNSFLFKQFRTLSQKHPGVGYPSRSIFPFPFTLPRKQRISKPCVFYSLGTLSFSVSRKSFACHSLVPSGVEGYENCRVCTYSSHFGTPLSGSASCLRGGKSRPRPDRQLRLGGKKMFQNWGAGERNSTGT